LDLELASGVKVTSIVAALFLLMMVESSCALMGKKEPEPEDTSGADSAADWEEGEREKVAEKDAAEVKEKSVLQNGLSYPQTTDFDEIQRLLIKNRTPDQENLKLCRGEIESLSDKVTNVTDLVSQRKSLSYEVNNKPNFYHWCFYYTMFTLENELMEDNLGTSISDKYKAYNKSIKGMWLLGDSLSYHMGNSIYIRQLRSKYLELSRNYFGRDLETGVSFDEYERIESPSRLKKPAGNATQD
jgi:hypothetical protein